MSRLYAVIIATFFFTNLAVANEPTISSAPAPIAHQWQKNADLVIGHIRNTTLNRMKNTTADIISCFRDSILTQGEFSPVWHGEYFPAVNGGPQIRFGVRCIFYNNEDSAQDSNNDLTVFANDISPLLGHLKLNFTEYTTVKSAGDQGYYEFDMANGLHVKAWLITADSTSSPYIAVSRKEYLEEAKKELDALKDIVISDDRGRIHIRTAAEQEAEKQQMLQQLRSTYSGVELETRTRIYLNNYMKDPDLLIQTIARDVAGYNKTIRMIDSLLRNSTAQDLAKPAVVPPALVGKLAAAGKRDYTPQFPLRLMHKDFGLIIAAAEESGLFMPATESAAVVNAAEAALGRDEDFSAVIRLMEQRALLETTSSAGH